MLTSCIKAAKDLVDDIEARTACIERLAQYNDEEVDTCAELTSIVNAILNDCGEFLTQEEKDNLASARDNCVDG
ncbi:MAG: hypothetical protein AB8B59_04545 [Maribacter sp.]